MSVASFPSLVELCFNVISCTENFIQLNGDTIKEQLPVELLQRLLQHVVDSVQSRLLSQAIALKIRLVAQGQRLVTFRFQLHGTVQSTVFQIHQRLNLDNNNNSNGSNSNNDNTSPVHSPVSVRHTPDHRNLNNNNNNSNNNDQGNSGKLLLFLLLFTLNEIAAKFVFLLEYLLLMI